MKAKVLGFLKSFMDMLDGYLYWAEHGKNCSFCRWRYSPELMVDTGHKGWYACPKCWREIQELMSDG